MALVENLTKSFIIAMQKAQHNQDYHVHDLQSLIPHYHALQITAGTESRTPIQILVSLFRNESSSEMTLQQTRKKSGEVA